MAKVESKKSLQMTVTQKKAKPVFRMDVKETAILIKAARESAANAIRTSKALNLPITYMQNGVVIKEQANGVKEILIPKINTPKPTKKQTTIKLKKGMVLYAKK